MGLEANKHARVVTTTRRITMADVDPVQVHFASYFEWLDGAYHALLAQLGHPLVTILAEDSARQSSMHIAATSHPRGWTKS